MSQWYLSKDGQALGPLPEDKLIELIKNKEVSPMDLVYRSGATQWLPISQVASFNQHFSAVEESAPSEQPEMAKQWVILKKVTSEKGSEFKQLGPFAVDQVLQLIDQGDVKFTDHAWKKGMESWAKISGLAEFASPLPSTPAVDSTLYEPTQWDKPEVTITKEDEKTNLSSLIKIEKFEHTEEAIVAQTPTPDFVEESGTVASQSTLLTTDQGAETFVEDTPLPNEELEKTALWSLEPPATGEILKGNEAKKEELRAARAKETEDEEAGKDKKASAFPKLNLSMDSEFLPWIAVMSVVLISAFLFYKSFQSRGTEMVYDPEKQILQDTDDRGAQMTAEDVEARMPAAAEPPAMISAPLPPVPKPVVREINAEKKAPTKLKLKAKKVVKNKKVDKVQKMLEQVRKVAESKRVVRKTIEKKKSNKNLKKQARPRSKVRPVTAKGSAKSRSFYRQRDRKALFYSSLKAETLVVDIERQYKKLKGNKGAWSRYYSQWQKKVTASLAKEIRSFPSAKEKYAYPSIMKSFKRDHAKIFTYGEAFNARVAKKRVPSRAPKDLKKTFSRYRNQAKSLGR